MNFKRNFDQEVEPVLKVIIDTTDLFLELRLAPRNYFYPSLVNDFCSEYKEYDEEVHDKEEDLSEEQFEKRKKKSIKMNKMFRDEKYKELFETKIRENLESFLRESEHEAEIEYEELISKGIPIYSDYPFKQEETLLDKHFLNDDDAIFNFLKQKGVYFLRNRKILSRIEWWCKEKETEKIEKLTETIKEIAGTKPGPSPLSLDAAMNILNQDHTIRREIKEIKEKIKFNEKEIRYEKDSSKKIISECKSYRWLKILKKALRKDAREGDIGDIELIRFIRDKAPRDISIKIIAEKIERFERTVEEIFRIKKRIIEEYEKERDEFMLGNQKLDKIW